LLNRDEILRQIIEGDLVVSPPDDVERRLQPASLDVCLGDTFAVYRRDRGSCIDPKVDSAHLLEYKTVTGNDAFVIHPGEFVLATTREYFELPNDLVARVEGKSSLGRLGLLVHSTAGFVDPLFAGEITLELACVNSLPIRLYPGMPIAQLAFQRTRTVREGYKGKYVGQRGPTASRYYQNWDGAGW